MSAMKEDEARAPDTRPSGYCAGPMARTTGPRPERKTTGLIKMVTGKKGTILGVSIVGANAGEMINTWALAISKEMTVQDVAGYVPPYPTMSEIGKRRGNHLF